MTPSVKKKCRCSALALSGLALATLLSACAHPADPSVAQQAGPFPDMQADKPGSTMQEGRELSRAFLDGQTETLWTRMTPQMQQALGSAAALAQFRAQVAQQLGEEQSLIDETTSEQGGHRVYRRTARWSKTPGPIVMQWTLDGQDRIVGFFVRPQPQAAPSPHLDYQTKADLRLPFRGQWYVFWGGRTLAQNYHAANANQRFAYDFLQRVDGASHRGDGDQLSDYYCWDESILAPADGRVIEVVENLPDQAIGTRNTEAPAGNHVLLDLGHDEYAVLAHLQQSSVQVEAGQQVQAGDVLGLCGNSGNTSEPHLHFHLQDSAVALQGDGLPAFFNHYIADGKPVARGEPHRGQVIAPAPAPSSMQPDPP